MDPGLYSAGSATELMLLIIILVAQAEYRYAIVLKDLIIVYNFI